MKKMDSQSIHTLYFTLTQIFSGGKTKINLHMTLKLTVFMPISCLMQSRRHLVSSPEPKAQGELIVWDSSRRPCVHTLNMNISETSWPIIIKFHQEQYWGGGLTALSFG